MKRQRGAALIIGLILLLVLTILGVASMKSARFQLLMSGNEQFYVQAMNAAEAAIEAQIASNSFLTTYEAPSNEISANMPDNISGSSRIQFLNSGTAPDGGYSDGTLTYRFLIEADGASPAGADARARIKLRQGIYILAPGGS
ncbi:MAG TPA: PilX N-terminal domain-containing pilus assembly protein [Gammaproteobacteria bacterium]